MKRFIFAALALAALWACTGASPKYENRADAIAAQIHDPASKYVVVACHRGDWRNYPENSIPAIESVIAMEADIVEIDIHMTADSVLVLCHDNNVKRTTNFSKVFRSEPDKSAKISDLTLEEIKSLSLKRAHGVAIDTLRMPTLREALLCTKDRICVNIDKGYDYYDKVLAITEELGMTDQVLIKSGRPLAEVRRKLSEHPHNMMYMPVISVAEPAKMGTFDGYVAAQPPQLAYELCFGKLNDNVRQAAQRALASGSKIWVNTIWGSLCGEYDDDRAFDSPDPDAVYGPILDLGTSIIQTDRPEFLIRYLEKKGRRKF